MKLFRTALIAITSVVGAVGMVGAAPLNPLAIYTFDNADGTDSSGNGNHGTIVGAGGTTFTDAGGGRNGVGRAMDSSVFAGRTGIETGININPNVFTSLTMGAWVYARSTGGRGIGKFLSHDDGSFDRTVGLDDRGGPGTNYGAFTGSGLLKPAGPDPIGKWFHIAVSYDGANVNLWRNGALAGTATDNTDFDLSIWNLHIGTNPGFNEDFDGLIDDAFVYGRALDEKEVKDIYQNGFGPVSQVPIPATLPLLIGGFAVFGFLRRRR